MPSEVIQRYQRVNVDPYCEWCKANGAQVEEDRGHILVDCPGNERFAKQLVEDILAYINTVVLQPVKTLPNWFMAEKWETAQCRADLVPGLQAWVKAAGMCGFMPNCVLDWLRQLPLRDVASKVAARLNRMIMQMTVCVLKARAQRHRSIVKEKCHDLKMKRKRNRAPRKYR